MPVPYLHFTDTCREAMTFYQSIFGGELILMGWDEAPGAPEEFKDAPGVMHAILTTARGPLMASDAFPGQTAAPQTSVSVNWDCQTPEEGQDIYNKLLDGGEVTMPFEPTFFSAGFGMVKDRFGTHWMIMTYPDPAPGAG